MESPDRRALGKRNTNALSVRSGSADIRAAFDDCSTVLRGRQPQFTSPLLVHPPSLKLAALPGPSKFIGRQEFASMALHEFVERRLHDSGGITQSGGAIFDRPTPPALAKRVVVWQCLETGIALLATRTAVK